jgi:uncharacterized protein
MLSPEICQFIGACAKAFNVRAVWVFGSSLGEESTARDIDLAVECLSPEQFFKFYGELYFGLPKPVDLVDLSEDPPLASIIRQKGVKIYG